MEPAFNLAQPKKAIHELVGAHARELSSKLQAHRLQLFPPEARKTLRRFSSIEAAKLIGINDGYLRRLSLEGKGPQVDVGRQGRRSYTVEDIQALREFLDIGSKADRRYVPRRDRNEHLQVITVVNFKGGSGKTTTAAHLAQYHALRGYRVLAIDLDPQASLSALHGFQPEFDVGDNQTLYGAIRYDDQRRDLKEIIRKTYFANLDLVPGNLELMEFEHETPKALMGQKQMEMMFFTRMDAALASVADDYDIVVVDCPPQLGFLTLSALCCATAVLVTVHPQMLDVMSMCQFLIMTSDLLGVVANAGGNMGYDWMRYLITRYEPGDGPQNQMMSFMRSMFGEHVLNYPMLKSTAISDAGITKQTLYEVSRDQFTRSTYDRALEALDNVNGEIEQLILSAWGARLMARKNLLAGLLDEKLPAGNSAGAHQPTGPIQPIQGLQSSAFGPRGGAIGAVTRSIEQMKAHAVLDLAAEIIDASLIADRLADTSDDHHLLVASIREHGQQVPILVRPHPSHEGRYQIAYGRRRLRALKELGWTVRAIVKPLSDEQLVVAQGQENSARTDLSFIEKALFAARLEESGFTRDTIMSALSVDKSGLSRLISSAVKIPSDIIEAIGPAPKAGRDRWIELSTRLDGAAPLERARKAAGGAHFSALSSDERFGKIFEAVAPQKPKTQRPTIWKSEDGLRVASIRDDAKAVTVTIDKTVAADFGAYLVETIPEIYAAFKRRADA